jgi:uncharacterized protein (DUF302 family)
MSTLPPRHATPYGFGVTLRMRHPEALLRTREALATQGFGVLTEIDVSQTLHTKIGVDFPPYVILGACNPPLAHQALTAEREIGLLLPCNVIVHAAAPGAAETTVSVMDPVAALELSGNAEVGPLATEVRGRLERVLDALATLDPG